MSQRKVCAGDLNRYGRSLKQFVVADVGVDQTTLDAAFKNSKDQQTLHNGHIACK